MAETSSDTTPRVFFQPAPALEALFALNALVRPERRRFLATWVESLQAQLSKSEREALTQLRRLPELVQVGDLTVYGGLQEPKKLASLIKKMAPDKFAAVLLGQVVTPERIAALRQDKDGPKQLRLEFPWLWNGDEAVLEAIVRDAAALRDACAKLLPRVWELGVEPMLPQLEPLWEETLAQAEAEAQGKAPRDFAVGVFGKPFARRYGPDYVFPRYVFVPTYFYSPQRVVFFEPDVAVLTLDCRLGPWTNQIARDRLAEGLRAVAEESRLEMLRLLAMDKGFGGWVAGRLKLNPATVTHHLNVLRKAGLVQEVEGPPGAAKYYRTDREALQKLLKLLQDYVDSNIAPDWEGAKR